MALTAFPAARSPSAGEVLGAASPASSPLPWPSRSLQRSALPGSPRGANMSTLQASLDGTGGWVAPPAQRDTPLRHTGSPQRNGSLLRGSLAMTATGLAPGSCQCLAGHTRGWLAAGILPQKRGSRMVVEGVIDILRDSLGRQEHCASGDAHDLKPTENLGNPAMR